MFNRLNCGLVLAWLIIAGVIALIDVWSENAIREAGRLAPVFTDAAGERRSG
jgi:hypothetical protein